MIYCALLNLLLAYFEKKRIVHSVCAFMCSHTLTSVENTHSHAVENSKGCLLKKA